MARSMVLGWFAAAPSGAEVYSRELVPLFEGGKKSLDPVVRRIGETLRALEQEGLLTSRFQEPPHADGGGMARRYYRLVDLADLLLLDAGTEVAGLLDGTPRSLWPRLLSEWVRRVTERQHKEASCRPTRARATDGTLRDVCVVCGDLLLPGPPPYCEGMHGDLDELEDGELHIPRSQW